MRGEFMNAKEVLDIALMAGEILVSNGSESYRVEETMERICRAYNYKSQCITTGKGIFLSVLYDNQEKVTSLMKSKNNSVDLYTIELVNNFSRQVEENQFTYDEAKKRLDKIKNTPHYRLPVRVLAGGMTCFIYCLFFNGKIIEALVSTMIGMLIYYMVDRVTAIGFFQFFIFFFSGCVIGGIATFLEWIFPWFIKDNIILGSIMVLLPGVAFTNGVKDIIYGDFISGIARCSEAVLVVVAIGSGIGASLVLSRL